MTVPTFTPTPVIAGTSAADMPQALGPRIGATTDSNFAALDEWVNDLDSEHQVWRAGSGTSFITPSTNYSVGGNSHYFFNPRTNVHMLYAIINRTGGAALASTTAGAIASHVIATVSCTAPTSTVFFAARCAKGPFLNMYLNTARTITLRGCSVASYTFPVTFTTEFELWWIA